MKVKTCHTASGVFTIECILGTRVQVQQFCPATSKEKFLGLGMGFVMSNQTEYI